MKKFFFLFVFLIYSVSTIMGQSEEELYLQEAIELMIIRETSRTNDRAQKYLALEYIENMLKRGSTNSELRDTLEYLSLEGSQSRYTIINYPDVRSEAVRLLRYVRTPEAKNALIRVCYSENEPLVLAEAIRSLGIICLNDNNDTIGAVVWVFNRNRYDINGFPNNRIALAVLDTFGRITEKYRNIEPSVLRVINVILEESLYAPVVHDIARSILSDVRNYIINP